MEVDRMLVLVTGASGYLGGRVCVALARNPRYKVRAMLRKASSSFSSSHPGVEVAYGDVRDLPSLFQAFSGCDAVIHSAAAVGHWLPDSSLFFKVNVGGLENIIKALKETPTIKKMVYVSTFFAMGSTEGNIGDEEQIHPGNQFCNDYEKSKVEADSLARKAVTTMGLPITLVYPGVVYGPGAVTAGNSLFELLTLRCKGLLFGNVGDGKDRLSFCHVDDVASGCISAIEKGRVGERYLLTGDNAAFNEVLSIVDGLRGARKSSITIPLWAMEVVGRVLVLWAQLSGRNPLITPQMVRVLRKQWCYSHKKAEEELGYHSRPLRDGLAEYLTWVQSHA